MSKKINKKDKIIVILGPTASGKTGLGVKLAQKFNGEIISADSRQVYKGMDIGTGKDLAEYWVKVKKGSAGEAGLPRSGYAGARNDKIKIPHHLIDVVDPKAEFSLVKFKKKAEEAIKDILKRNRVPIVVGGTGLYLQALVDNYNLSPVGPDKKLRNKLERKNNQELLKMLNKINSEFTNKLHESDQKNKRRLIRYIEILGSQQLSKDGTTKSDYEFLLIGLTWPREVIRERIDKRLIDRLEKEKMVEEVERLQKEGVSWKRLIDFGLEYKYIALYLQGKLKYDEMVEKLSIVIKRFAKKQMTWFRRWQKQGRKIFWIKSRGEAEKLVKKFLE